MKTYLCTALHMQPLWCHLFCVHSYFLLIFYSRCPKYRPLGDYNGVYLIPVIQRAKSLEYVDLRLKRNKARLSRKISKKEVDLLLDVVLQGCWFTIRRHYLDETVTNLLTFSKVHPFTLETWLLYLLQVNMRGHVEDTLLFDCSRVSFYLEEKQF
jgi:hypothetical protein